MRRLAQSLVKRWKRLQDALARIEDGSLQESFLVSLLGKGNPVILDIGCNDGQETRLFLRLFPNAKVYSFEPDDRARRRFQDLTSDPRAQLFPLALGSINGKALFFASTGSLPEHEHSEKAKDWDFSGSIHAPRLHLKENPWVSFKKPVEVPIRTLDSWAEENSIDKVDFIWADVQGAEVDLITGGRNTLRRTRFFYTEYSDKELYAGQVSFKQLCCLLPGFKVRRRFRHDVLLENRAWQSETK